MRFLMLPITLMLVLTLSACDLSRLAYQKEIKQGNIWDEAQLQQIHEGMSTQEVVAVLGDPVLVNTFDSQRLDYVYYVHSRNEFKEYKQASIYFTAGKVSRITISPVQE